MDSLGGQHMAVRQALRWGTNTQERLSPADTLFALTGRRLYVIGDIDGRFRPRSNPYDLHTYGKPHPDDPLANRLQGVWAQPVKGLSGYAYTIEEAGETWSLEDAHTFTQTFACARFEYQRGELSAARADFVAQDLPLLISSLTLHHTGASPRHLRVAFSAQFDLADAWFTRLGGERNAGHGLSIEQGRLIARARVLPERWVVVVGGARPADEPRLIDDQTGELVYRLTLNPGEMQTLTFGVVVESTAGTVGALETLTHGLDRAEELWEEKNRLYQALFDSGPHLISPDPLFNLAFDLARANMQFLEAESPGMGRYFYAGLEIFPFWFSNDGAYSIVGMFAAGLRGSALNHLRIGLRSLEDGRVPHQISPAGNVAFQGNAQETPLWVSSLWDAYRWTGDQDFLAEVYPGALQGMFDYVLGAIDPDGDGYASGPGMVEVEGMGPEKLDTAAYTWSALLALAEMAHVLGDAANEHKARDWAVRIATRFDQDWWGEGADPTLGGTYAMSLLDPGNARYAVPHWAVIVPLEVGLAAPDHAARTFATLRADYLNRWGLKHTVGDDERVWTLPTATLSRAAFRYGEPGLGFEMLRHVAETLETGSIGLFHELIPEGACFVQLWSGAVFLRGVIEDLLGIQVQAAEHTLRVNPQLPETWDEVTLQNLAFGEHRVNVRFSRTGVSVEQLAGPVPLQVLK